MPNMSGIEATKEIRRIERGGRDDSPYHNESQHGERILQPTPGAPSDATPTESMTLPSTRRQPRVPVIIIALTTLASQADGVEVLEAGCDDFLPRPVSLPSLKNKIMERVPKEGGGQIAID